MCGHLGEPQREKVMVVSSAGNTAHAFAQVCSDNNINALWFEKPLNPCVRLLCTESGSDYFDAINIGNIICEMDGCFAVSNEEAMDACKMFEELEGIDIYSAAGVATASLIQAIENKQVKADDVIMLNITGGGERLFK